MVLSSAGVRDEPARVVAGDLLEGAAEDCSSHETYLSMSMSNCPLGASSQ